MLICLNQLDLLVMRVRAFNTITDIFIDSLDWDSTATNGISSNSRDRIVSWRCYYIWHLSCCLVCDNILNYACDFTHWLSFLVYSTIRLTTILLPWRNNHCGVVPSKSCLHVCILRLLYLLVSLTLWTIDLLDNITKVESVLYWRSSHLLIMLPWVLSVLLLVLLNLLHALAPKVLKISQTSIVFNVINDSSQVLLLRWPYCLIHYVHLYLLRSTTLSRIQILKMIKRML